jgi:hypothetical protein
MVHRPPGGANVVAQAGVGDEPVEWRGGFGTALTGSMMMGMRCQGATYSSFPLYSQFASVGPSAA